MRITIKELRKIIKETVLYEMGMGIPPEASEALQDLIDSKPDHTVKVAKNGLSVDFYDKRGEGTQYAWVGGKWKLMGSIMKPGMVGMEPGVDSHYDRIDRRNMRNWHGQ